MKGDSKLIQILLEFIQSKQIDELMNQYDDIEELLFNNHITDVKTKYGLTLIIETIRRILYEIACKYSFYENAEHILYYLKFLLSNLDHECFYTLDMNKKGYITDNKLQNIGTIDRVAIYPREIIKSFIHKKPYGLIIVHNHPSGNPTPSQSDINITNQLIQILEIYQIYFIEHIIISKNGFTMLKKDGYLN